MQLTNMDKIIIVNIILLSPGSQRLPRLKTACRWVSEKTLSKKLKCVESLQEEDRFSDITLSDIKEES